MTQQPTTLREHFRADPRGADSFGRWIEDRVWEMLQRPAFVTTGAHRRSAWVAWEAIRNAMHEYDVLQEPLRVCLEDGTVIKEWPAKET